MRGRRNLEEAAAMTEHRQSSGLTIQAFCEETSVLVPINIEKTGRRCEADMENLELTYPNGVRISVSRHSELNLIRELILGSTVRSNFFIGNEMVWCFIIKDWRQATSSWTF
jgi:predicted RNA-binding protein with PUA domain